MAASPELNEVPTASLLAELERRGALAQLHGAIGALHDQLSNTGVMDGNSSLTPYLVYRLRKHGAALIGSPDVAAHVRVWDKKIAELDLVPVN